MKIGIETLPFNTNYGGILQSYALMAYLKRIGHSPLLINYQTDDESYLRLPFVIAQRLISKYILRRKNMPDIIPNWVYKKRNKNIEENCRLFIKDYINPKTKPIYTDFDLLRYNPLDCDAYIVGSDQIWRPEYFRLRKHAFFDFVSNKDAILLSYAPSFGVDEWRYSPKETLKAKKQLSRFRAVSVREKFGVDSCKKYWNVEAKQVIDPTLLLEREDYINLSNNFATDNHCGRLFSYFLDRHEGEELLIQIIAKKYGHKPFNVYELNDRKKYQGFLIQPPIQLWIKSFMMADYVITDSYHGCIFSIIFNKPFIVLGNKQRGIARITSLLEDFGLRDRLLASPLEVKEESVNKEIDWNSVNDKLNFLKEYSKKFLTDNLIK